MTPSTRRFVGPFGVIYRASIAPMERSGRLGVDPRLNAICFQHDDGRWIGSVPLYHSITLDSLTYMDLIELLEQAT